MKINYTNRYYASPSSLTTPNNPPQFRGLDAWAIRTMRALGADTRKEEEYLLKRIESSASVPILGNLVAGTGIEAARQIGRNPAEADANVQRVYNRVADNLERQERSLSPHADDKQVNKIVDRRLGRRYDT